MPILADIYNCSGCLSCVESCPTGALSPRWNEEGHLTYGLNMNKCIDCKKCEKNCPAINGYEYGVNNLNLSTPYAAWSNDEELRKLSTSGGVFASIAKYIISQGGVVFGAAMIENEVKHICINSIDDLHLLQGSKYTQSNTAGTFKQAYEILKEGRLVLYSGLGCQIAGLLNFMRNSRLLDNLYTIDLICGGVPSRSLITKFLDHEDIKGIHSFRKKSKYELSIVTNGNKIEVVPLSSRPLPLCGFYTELTNKYICYDCRYVGAHRQSDMTIGDYWGDTQFVEEHENGLSIAILHSNKIKNLVLNCDVSIHEVGWSIFLRNNTRMVYGKNNGWKHRRRKRLAKAIANDSYESFVIDYANGTSFKHPLLFLRKVIRYLQGRFAKKKRITYVNEILKQKTK